MEYCGYVGMGEMWIVISGFPFIITGSGIIDNKQNTLVA